MGETSLEYEDALRELLGLVGRRVVIHIYAPGWHLAARFSGLLKHANQDKWADNLYESVGLEPVPEALFFSVDPYALHPLLAKVDSEDLYGFAIPKHAFNEGHKRGRVLFLDLGDVRFAIGDADASSPADG